MTITHREGCEIAAKALHKKFNCGAVFIESLAFSNYESPDAIGFRPGGCSILVEVKVSRSDFLSDKKKPHRQDPAKGMGAYRFYACPEGIIKPEDLPPKWGLLYFTPRGSVKVIVAPYFYSAMQSPEYYRDIYSRSNRWGSEAEKFGFFERNHVGEMNIMYGGWRQLCLAQKDGLHYTVGEVHVNPLKRK